MEKQKLYILTGLPYSGKTTLRNELIKSFGFSIVSVDDINDEKGVGVPETQEVWDWSYSEAYRRLKESLEQGKTTIFDGASLRFSERQTQRDICKSLGIECVLIYVKTPIEEINARREKNLKTKERGHVRDDHFAKAQEIWDEPTPEENHIIYTQDMNLDEWINGNIKVD